MCANLFVAQLVQRFYGTEATNVPPILRDQWAFAGLNLPRDLIIPVVASLAVAALWFAQRHSRWGRAIRAVADDQAAARLAGIQADRMLAQAVGVSALLAGLAGALIAPNLTVRHDLWVHPLLVSFAVVVVGGRGSLLAAVATAVAMGVAEVFVERFWNQSAGEFVALAVVLIGLVAFPTGLARLPQIEMR
jgi:branched-chain amino acid transport system permease protein